MNRHTIILIGLLISIASGAWAGEQGYVGLSLSVDGERFSLNPTLKQITIDKVAPNSPAAQAGIEPGDLLLEIDGRKIAGAKAKDIKPCFDKEVGETVHLVVRKASGEVHQVTLVAAPKSD